MKKVFFCVLFLSAIQISGFGQNLIGIKKDMAEEFVRKEVKGFNLDNTAKNESFNYLKFINSAGTKTLIIFFSDENISTRTRMVCDFSELDFVTEELNAKYKNLTKTSWEYTSDNVKYIINLEEKEWYFVVSTKKSN
jgi:hypothetical protein